MFIGHVGVGFGAKRAAPGASLGVLVAAPLLLDLLWPLPSNPDSASFRYTHSLLTAGLAGIVFGVVYWAITRYSRGAIVISLGVVSHWILDTVAHPPDLPLIPCGTMRVGLGLQNSAPGIIAAEVLTFGIGVFLYLSSTRHLDRIGRFAMWGLLPVVVISAPFPPALWLFPLLAWWIDRHRRMA